MNPDKKIQIVARKVKQATAKQAESVPLDQPFPEELDQPPSELHEYRKEAKSEEAKKDGKEEEHKPTELLPPKQDDDKKSKKEAEQDEQSTLIAGYKVSELAAAPIKPPEPEKTEGRRATKSPSVVFLMGLGIVLFVLGVVLALSFNAVFGIIVALLGAVAVIGGVFVPLR